jgi:AcrR family transcriptional regulator
MSIEIQLTAKEPKRARGKERVAALLDAAAALIARKGYEATTMTEIAQRAGAAIGSLYQFFPSKEALAEALFNRYAERAAAEFQRVEELAPGASPARLADLLVDYRLALRSDRDAAIALSGSVASIMERRKPMGDALRGRVAALLRSGHKAMSERRAATASAIICQILKTVPALAAAEDESRLPLVDEARKLLALYIERIVGS